jgi:hypothetical protein
MRWVMTAVSRQTTSVCASRAIAGAWLACGGAARAARLGDLRGRAAQQLITVKDDLAVVLDGDISLMSSSRGCAVDADDLVVLVARLDPESDLGVPRRYADAAGDELCRARPRRLELSRQSTV